MQLLYKIITIWGRSLGKVVKCLSLLLVRLLPFVHWAPWFLAFSLVLSSACSPPSLLLPPLPPLSPSFSSSTSFLLPSPPPLPLSLGFSWLFWRVVESKTVHYLAITWVAVVLAGLPCCGNRNCHNRAMGKVKGGKHYRPRGKLLESGVQKDVLKVMDPNREKCKQGMQ